MATRRTSTSLRLLHLMQALPSTGKTTVRKLMEKLGSLNYAVNARMIERDLVKLEDEGLARGDGAKPQGWSRGGKGLGLQLRDPTEALALEILAKHAAHLLPPSVSAQLSERFEEARRTLGTLAGSDVARWSERVAVIPLSQPLIPPKVDPAVQRAVLEALLHRQVLKIRYRGRNAARAREQEVHLAGLVEREGQYILVGFFAGNPQPYQWAMHRMQAAAPIDQRAHVPADFDFQAYARSGAMGMGDGEGVRLELVFDEDAGRLFEESRLAEDQVVQRYELKSGEPRYRVTATLEDSRRLQAYLNSFGDSLISRRQRPLEKPRAIDRARTTQPSRTRK